jgi:hypothetical protein
MCDCTDPNIGDDYDADGFQWINDGNDKLLRH